MIWKSSAVYDLSSLCLFKINSTDTVFSFSEIQLTLRKLTEADQGLIEWTVW